MVFIIIIFIIFIFIFIIFIIIFIVVFCLLQQDKVTNLEAAPFSEKEANCSYFRYCTLICSITLFMFSFFKTLQLSFHPNLVKIRPKFLMIRSRLWVKKLLLFFSCFWMQNRASVLKLDLSDGVSCEFLAEWSHNQGLQPQIWTAKSWK